MRPLAGRQVHLDFHTSEFIGGIGERFDKRQFQAALQQGHVNSITVFAKCHHSWCYYPTTAGRMHPSLSFDLLGEMIDAGHEIGVRVPVYITVGWSSNDAEQYPECVERTKDGAIRMSRGEPDADPAAPRPIVSWKFMCPSGRYAELIYAQTREVCARYPELDGLFYDICFHHSCYCDNCLKGMREAGLDAQRDEDAYRYYQMKWKMFTDECRRILTEYHPDATLFFNGSARLDRPEWDTVNTHMEMEDLPTHWGGYDKMPLQAQYYARVGQQYLGMTGKFHTMWGEFGGFKSAAALTYEAAAMMTYGARCSVGDQLHPNGEMDRETYRLIGEAYRYAEQIEPWCFEAKDTTRLGVMLSPNADSNEGMTKVLLEGKLDFRLVLQPEDLAELDAVVLPDDVTLNARWAEALAAMANRGGGVLLTGTSGLDAPDGLKVPDELAASGGSEVPGGPGATGLSDAYGQNASGESELSGLSEALEGLDAIGKSNGLQRRFLLDIGAEYAGANADDCDYLLLGEPLLNGPGGKDDRGLESQAQAAASSLVATPFLCYEPATRIRLTDGEALAERLPPFFNRTYGHYCSHQNTPNRLTPDQPGAMRKGSIVYFAHPIFRMYKQHGMQLHRDYALRALKLVCGNPVLNVAGLPSAGRARLVRQPQEHRYVLHLLYASPIQRGGASVIEDMPPIYQVQVDFAADRPIKRAYLAPQGHDIPITVADGRVQCVVPKVECHQIVVFDEASPEAGLSLNV